VAKRGRVPCIYVLAGTNGAGKSSIAGAAIRAQGAEYFNPDEAAALIRAANSGITLPQANSAAWNQGRRLLERAIAVQGRVIAVVARATPRPVVMPRYGATGVLARTGRPPPMALSSRA